MNRQKCIEVSFWLESVRFHVSDKEGFRTSSSLYYICLFFCSLILYYYYYQWKVGKCGRSSLLSYIEIEAFYSLTARFHKIEISNMGEIPILKKKKKKTHGWNIHFGPKVWSWNFERVFLIPKKKKKALISYSTFVKILRKVNEWDIGIENIFRNFVYEKKKI